MGDIIETIGAEFESIIMGVDEVAPGLPPSMRGNFHTITTDASVQSLCAPIGRHSLFLGNTAINRMLARRNTDRVMGFEAVTRPLRLPEMRKTIRAIINSMSRNGEIFSPRSSIHFHVGYPPGLVFFKTALALGLRIEPLLYKIAGLGEPYRGAINKSAYARPLALPPAVPIESSRKFAVLNPKAGLNATNTLDFWKAFGISSGDRRRYVAPRYFAVNIYSILLRGTVEQRFFNFCNRATWVEAVASLCQNVAELMYKCSISDILDLPEISIFTPNKDREYTSFLDKFLALSKEYRCTFTIDSESVDTLSEIIETTPQPVFVNEIVRTHAKDHFISIEDADKFDLEIVDKAVNPGIEDIHNFTLENRSLI